MAGKTAYLKSGTYLPNETISMIKEYGYCLKAPLETPVGKGMRSVNVQIRRELDLYACVRPIEWFDGVVSPIKEPRNVDMTVFRENTKIYMQVLSGSMMMRIVSH